ncbi:MAG: RNA-guided endonuclease TnpB family protein [Calothrix sp. MO_192.B10]|nr:RNA-guided endonuclease TnpB family protein [Calothrix sp. MO_192.B10]
MSDVMLLGVKTKLNLTDAQKVLMSKHAGIKRFTYNWGLATWQELYNAGCKFNHRTLRTFFNKHLKAEYPWIKEKGICQKITEFAFEDLNAAFFRFFDGIAEYPKFKKKGNNDSFTVNCGGKPMPFGGNSIKLPTIGWVKLHEGLPHGTTSKVTISRIADDWYIAFTYYHKKPVKIVDRIPAVGVDLGIKTLATLSTGVIFHNAKYLAKNLKQIAHLHQELQRKIKGSNNRNKAKTKLQRMHRRIAFLRNDLLHKITNYICKNHAIIVIEDLNISGMLKNGKLSKAISDCGFHEFKRQLEYKSKKFGCELIIADRWYPSSQLCSTCGHKHESLTLKDRVYKCSNCALSIDRDLNAALNLLKLAFNCVPRN